MKLETKLLATLVAASVCLSGTLVADDNKEKINEPAGAEIQLDTSDTQQDATGLDTEKSLNNGTEVDEPAGAESGTPEEKFVKKASQGSLMEIRMGEMAAQKAESGPVKQFGDKLARDHEKANEKLKEIAQRKSITLSEELKDKHQEKLQEIGGLSGEQFDREFLKVAVEGHKKAIKEYEKQAQEGEDPAIRSYASETLPVLREHLRIAQLLQDNPRADIPELREAAGAQPGDEQQQQPPAIDESQPDDSQQDDSSTDSSPAPLPRLDDSNSQQP